MAPNTHQKELDELNSRLEQLKTAFTLYFQGIERHNPAKDRDDLQKEIALLRRDASRWNTADRFRMNSIHQKFVTYNRMWERSLTEIENGTFRRDLKRVERKRKAEEQAQAQQAAAPPEAAAGQGQAPGRAAPAPVPAAARANGAHGGGGDGMSEDRMRRLYNVYMQAKKRTGERTSISFESLKAQLTKQIPAIKKKHNCENVDFKVVLKNGKAMLKAVPK